MKNIYLVNNYIVHWHYSSSMFFKKLKKSCCLEHFILLQTDYKIHKKKMSELLLKNLPAQNSCKKNGCCCEG